MQVLPFWCAMTWRGVEGDVAGLRRRHRHGAAATTATSTHCCSSDDTDTRLPRRLHGHGTKVGQLKEAANKAHNAELKLFLEVELGLDLKPLALPDKTREDILLFFKLYDPEKEQLRYVGRLFVKASGRPQDILPKLRKMAGFLQDDDVELYEEIKFEPNVMCEYIDNRIIFRSCQLEDGDIVCFQKSREPDTAAPYRYPAVPSFLLYMRLYMRNRQLVHFRSLEKPKEDDFCLEMSKIFTYDEVVEKVAEKIGVDDPSKIRLTSHNCYSQQPKPQPIKHKGVDRLLDMLIHYKQVIYRCTGLLRSWSSLQRMENRDLFTEVSTRLEDVAKEFTSRHGWLHSLRIAPPPV